MSDYNNLFSFDRISSKDIAETIKTELAPYYPEGDEKALILAAINFYERKNEVDTYGSHEPNFDRVEKLIVEIKRKILSFKEHDQGPETSIIVRPITVAGKEYGKLDEDGNPIPEFMLKTNYIPLILVHKEFLDVFEMKKTDQAFQALDGRFEDPWKAIDSFDPVTINYTEAQAKEKIDYVKNGLQDNTAAIRDAFVNDSLTLNKRYEKLNFQGSKYAGWKFMLDQAKDVFHDILFHEALVKDCETKIKRLGDLAY
jgi:hypothetical protein